MSAPELSLVRRWAIRADPDDIGIAQRWWVQPPTDGWRSIRADRAWQHVLGTSYHGVAWYRRRARLPKKWLGGHSRIWLRFEAVATDCRVWVNREDVGRHVGDYLPFQFEITHALAGGERCEIVCRVGEIRGREPAEPGKEPWGGHITKGFHDVLSLQHGGIWNGVSVRRTGPMCAVANGVRVRTDPADERMSVHVDLELDHPGGSIRVHVLDDRGLECAFAVGGIGPNDRDAEVGMSLGNAKRWNIDTPTMYKASVVLEARTSCEIYEVPVAFRTIETGGPDNRRILLNGRPLLIRGILHWGHEPEHIAPSPTPDQVRAEFAQLRELGFNCVCLCMWYPPEWFYDIADETGMLIWQQHPVWKSDMSDEHIEEYKRLFEGFFRRDGRHPSVVIVSATCEHERFNPELARWWWERAHELLPDKLLQVQTAFLSWADNDKTDLYDEHTYENTGRWLPYLDDLGRELAALPPKPFVMGETIIATHWPDVVAIDDALAGRDEGADADRPWWVTGGLDACRAFERGVRERFGRDTLERFRAQADAFALEHRKRQVEALRASALCAGWVMNHLRDVPTCRCGFMDDLGRWRLTPEQTRPWLGDATISLRTAGGVRAVQGGREIACEFVVSNFSSRTIDDELRLHLDDEPLSATLHVQSEPGRPAPVRTHISLPAVDHPTPLHLRAQLPGAESNAWTIWALPEPDPRPPDVVCLAGLEFTDDERAMTFEERRSSSGCGLDNATWRPALPDTAALFPHAPVVDPDALGSLDGVLVTHRLTPRVLTFVASGGRGVLLASRAPGGLDAATINLWAQVPLIVERGPIRPGESACIADWLHLDLTAHHQRGVPTRDMGFADHIEPFVRFVVIHDGGEPRVLDALFAMRIGAGLLAVSSLDHTEPAGRWLLDRLLAFAAAHDPESLAPCPIEQLRSHTLEH